MRKIWNVIVVINCECNNGTEIVFSSVNENMAMAKFNELKLDLEKQAKEEWGNDLRFTELGDNDYIISRNLERDLYDSGEFIEILCVENQLDNQKDFEKKFNFFE